MPAELFGHNIAVSCGHCVILIKTSNGAVRVVAGSINEYGYRDSMKGQEARFSCPKGLTCIRNCLFVTDFWNNVIRCVNLNTTQVETVMDFTPSAPVGLAVAWALNKDQ